MRYIYLTLIFACFSGAAVAQELVTTPLDSADGGQLQPLSEAIGELTTVPFDEDTGGTVGPRVDVANALGGRLRVLDKLTGVVTDLDLKAGESAVLGFLTVSIVECRYPVDNPAGDAFALVEVRDRQQDTELFAGWMLGSAPALNAMDHPRYDVWALRCTTSDPDGT